MIKKIVILTSFYSMLFLCIAIQGQNNIFSGQILYQNSDNTPAIGVEVSGLGGVSSGGANTVYTDNDGSFSLIFGSKIPGNPVKLTIGDTDKNKNKFDIVNQKELDNCRIPTDGMDVFKIIVCNAGELQIAMRKYYNILKSVAEIEYEKQKQEIKDLLAQKQVDEGIMIRLIDKRDSLEIKYQKTLQALEDQALFIASINLDQANDLVKEAVRMIEEENNVAEALNILDIEKLNQIHKQNQQSIQKSKENIETALESERKLVEAYEFRISLLLPQFKYQQISDCYEEIIDIYKTNEWDKEDLAYYYNKAAAIYRDNGKYNLALEFHEKSIKIMEAVLEENHPSLATSYNNIASIYQDLGQYEKALEFQEKDIKILERVLEENHPSLATSYNNIALTYQDLGQYEKALEFQEKSIKIMEAVLEENHPDIASSYNNIAATYQAMGQYEKALKFQGKSIKIMEAVLEENHPSLATSYNGIATTYYYLGQYDKALEFQKKAVTIFKETLPVDHPNQKIVLDVLLEIYYSKGMKDFEEKQLKSALANFDSILLYRMDERVYNYIGLCHYYLKDYDKAIIAYKKAVELNPELRTTYFYNNVGNAYVKNKDFKEAKASFEEYEKLYPKSGRVFRNWAMYHALKGDKEKALENLKKAIELGYTGLNWLNTDDSMDSLREEQQFIDILELLSKKSEE